MNKVMTVFLVLALSGCATNQLELIQSITESEGILVASLFEDRFFIQTTGTTAFQNDMAELDTSSWKVNDFVEARFIEGLEGKYKAFSNAEFRDRVTLPGDNYLTGYPSPITDEAVLQLARSLGAKYILLLSPIEFLDAYFGTNQYVQGYGIYRRSLYGESRTIQYAQMGADLFDAETGAFIATNGTIGHNNGDSVWITHQALGDMPELESGAARLNQDPLRYLNQELLAMLATRTMRFMKFIDSEPAM